MDTLLKPRELSETESDDTVNANSDFDLKKFANVDNNRNNIQDGQDDEVIVYPTARFLQVNSKQFSSYDLLVRPPKQPRLFAPSLTSQDYRAINSIPVPEEKLVLERVHFEDETRNYPQSKKNCIEDVIVIGNDSITSSNRNQQDPSVLNFIDSDLKPMNTILFAKDPTFLSRTSNSCQLVDGLFVSDATFESDDYVYQTQMRDYFEGESDGQEFLMQPNTYIKYSNSLHSGFETPQEPFKCSTTDRIIEQSTKSDYFVGKMAGLPKSLMKLYRKCVKTPSKDVLPQSIVADESFPAPEPEPEETKQLFENGRGNYQSTSVEKDFEEIPEKHDVKIEEVDINQNIEAHKVCVIQLENQPNMKDVLTAGFRKISSGNRISNVNIPNSFQLNRTTKDILAKAVVYGSLDTIKISPKLLKLLPNKQSVNTKRFAKEGLRSGKIMEKTLSPRNTALLKSSTSSSVAIKTHFLKKVHEKKQKDELDSNQNIVKRITRLFTRTKKIKNTSNSDVPLTKSRTIAQHTDSMELYRERRYRFFQEHKEFQEDSLKVYFQMLMDGSNQSSVVGSRQASLSFNDTVTSIGMEKASSSGSSSPSPNPLINLPYSTALPIIQFLQNTQSLNSDHSDDVIIPARPAISESAIPTTRNRPLSQNLLLQCPPMVHMLALTAQNAQSTPVNTWAGNLQDKLKPFKGILKKKHRSKQ